MKYLIWLVVILAAIWAFKRSRRAVKPPAEKATPPATPSNMVGCAYCGLHLPQEEAVTGAKGLYCSTEHRAAALDRNPA
jgi:uncharacterized protein